MSLLLSASGTALLVGGLAAITTSIADITITPTYSETSGGNVIAPGVVWLDVTGWSGWSAAAPGGSNTYDARLHKIEYYWTVPTKPGGADYAARTGINLPSSPSAFRDTSVQRGARVCIPVPTDGSYTVECFAVEVSSGKTCTKTVSFTAVTEDSAFPTTQTICHSIDNNFTGAPSGSTNTTTVGGLQTAVSNAITAGNPFRILLRRGETYTGANVDLSSQWTTSLPNCRINTYGSGADPIIDCIVGTSPLFTFPSGAGAKDVFIGPIHWRGTWDTTTETGKIPADTLISIKALEGRAVCYGSRATGVAGHGGFFPNGDFNSKVALVNCDLSDYATVGGSAFGPEGASVDRIVAMVGGRWGCIPGCIDGDANRGGTGESQYPFANVDASGWVFRLSVRMCLSFHHVAMTQSMGYDGTDGYQHQPILRLNQVPTSYDGGNEYYFSFCVFEGGASCIVLAESNDALCKPLNFVCDACLFFATFITQSFITSNATGMTVRNCAFHDWNQSGGYVTILNGTTATLSNGSIGSPIEFYNNTYYSKAQTEIRETQFLGELAGDFVGQNNINRVQSASDIVTTTTIAGMAYGYDGKRPGFPTIPHTLSGTWTNGGTFTISYPDSGPEYTSEGTAGQTDQTYWTTTVSGSDTFHAIRLANGDLLYATDGDFSVSFDASVITFTNNTGSNISAQDIVIKLDRKSRLANVAASGATDAQGTPAWCYIAAASEASFQISSGLKSDADIDGTRRGATAYQGATEYA